MDGDGDTVPDSVDVCPGDAGSMEFSGCPDSDGDFMPDVFDRCPDESGELIFDGCPDSDGDFLADSLDLCPAEHGERSFAGCSDSDGDAIADPFDSCPNEPGPPEFAGCPDSDGDYVPDAFDTCPDEAGIFVYDGCRDSDRDDIPDQFDACPDHPGPPEYAGCANFDSMPPDTELGPVQLPFGFGSFAPTAPEGFRFCYGVYDTQNLDLTEAMIFDDALIRPSSLPQTFDVRADDPNFVDVVSALIFDMPEGTGVGFGLGFFDCTGAGGTGFQIEVGYGEPIRLFRLTVPPFSIVETAPGFFEISASTSELSVSAFRWSNAQAGWEDSDFDDFPDLFDSCPLEPGDPPFGGCPDSDNDYFSDQARTRTATGSRIRPTFARSTRAIGRSAVAPTPIGTDSLFPSTTAPATRGRSPAAPTPTVTTSRIRSTSAPTSLDGSSAATIPTTTASPTTSTAARSTRGRGSSEAAPIPISTACPIRSTTARSTQTRTSSTRTATSWATPAMRTTTTTACPTAMKRSTPACRPSFTNMKPTPKVTA
jgi:hypothetical protein